MRRYITVILLLGFIGIQKANCQVSSSFLMGEIYQNNAINPAYFPKGKVFVGLPVLSGTELNLNLPLSYSDIFTRLDDGTNEIDIRKILSRLETNNYIGAQLRINDLYFGFRRNQAAISFFINDRVEADIYIPKSLVNLAINGNGSSIGSTIDFSRLSIRASHFREFGFSYTYFDKDDRFSVGYRAKFLNGFFDASLANNFVGSLTTTRNDLALRARLENAILRTSSVPADGSFIFSPNIGFGIDLGVNINLTNSITIGASIRDIGLIGWKDGISSNQVEDTDLNYSGIDLKDIDDIGQAVEDSLSDQFNLIDDITDPYTSWLPISGNITGSWKITGGTELVSSISPRAINGFVQMRYGFGINQKIGRTLKINVSANKLPRQDLNLGAALAVTAGPVQLYASTDRTLNYDLTTIKQFNYSFGINLILGRGKKEKERVTHTNQFRFLGGKPVKVLGKDKIYLIIPKQKKKDPVNNN